MESLWCWKLSDRGEWDKSESVYFNFPNLVSERSAGKIPSLVKTVTRLIVRRMAGTEMICHDQLVKVWTRRNSQALRGRVVGSIENKNISGLLVRDHLTPAPTQQREGEGGCAQLLKKWIFNSELCHNLTGEKLDSSHSPEIPSQALWNSYFVSPHLRWM